MWEFNYGEWSEAYVFLRLLGTGRIYAANEHFERDPNSYIDVVNIMRFEQDHTLRFDRILELENVQEYIDDTFYRLVPYLELNERADYLLNEMRTVTSNNRKFPVPEIEQYLLNLGFSQPKAPKMPTDIANRYGKKSDIIITVINSMDNVSTIAGFSIKSHLKGASTLFNCAPASNLRYEIVGCTDDIMNHINGNLIDSEKDVFSFIKNDSRLLLEFKGVSDAFYDNLDLIDSRMPEILSSIMLIQIGYYDKARSNGTADLVNKLVTIDPVHARNPELLYKAKIKEFLYDSFAGLTATELWDGRRKLSGGYIDVGANGEMLYYRAVSDDIFTTFLYNRTYFDRPSRGVNKDIAKVTALANLEGRTVTEGELHAASYRFDQRAGTEKRKPIKGDWGYIYKENHHFFININFQIRFK